MTRAPVALRVVALVLLVATLPAAGDDRRWESRAVPEGRGDVRVLPDGRREAVRYRGWTTRDFGAFRGYARDDARPEPAVQRGVMPAGVTGDPVRGRALFLARAKGPCTGCHLVPGADVWPAGNVGPDLSTIGDRGLPDAYLYTVVHDARVVLPHTVMPPWGTTGLLSPEEIVHLVAYLQTLRGPRPAEADAERDPATRARPAGFGDNLDPTNNPAVLLAEGAHDLWRSPGPGGASCAGCHGADPAAAMRGVAVRYPRPVAAYGRVMSIEDLLAVHAPATTGRPLPAQSADNLNLAMLVKMASNGLPVAVDVTSAPAREAWELGQAAFYRRVGERNHACADCHTPERGANRFLGGRLLADVGVGLTRHFPTWRTSQAAVWDMRRRMQWCMTPLGTNMLAADAPEYAALELYLTSFDNGKPLDVPGIRH